MIPLDTGLTTMIPSPLRYSDGKNRFIDYPF
jgi:hypothetical protein